MKKCINVKSHKVHTRPQIGTLRNFSVLFLFSTFKMWKTGIRHFLSHALRKKMTKTPSAPVRTCYLCTRVS